MLPKTAKDTKDSQSRLDFFLMLEKSFDKADLPCRFNLDNFDDWFDEINSLPDLQPVSDSEVDKTDLPKDFDDMDSLPDLQPVSNSEADEMDLLESFGKQYIIPSTYPSS